MCRGVFREIQLADPTASLPNFAKWCEIRFLKSKAEVFMATTELISLAKNQKGTKIKSLQSDKGREYTSNEFSKYLKKREITRIDRTAQPRTEWHGRKKSGLRRVQFSREVLLAR